MPRAATHLLPIPVRNRSGDVWMVRAQGSLGNSDGSSFQLDEHMVLELCTSAANHWSSK